VSLLPRLPLLPPKIKKEFVDTFQKAYDTLTQRKKEKEEKEKEKKVEEESATMSPEQRLQIREKEKKGTQSKTGG